jgi:5'-3' exonuclease
MPHFPAINIRTTGVEHVMAAYRSTIGLEKNRYLTDGASIDWKNMRRVIERLAAQEKTFLEDEYRLRSRWEKRSNQSNRPGEVDTAFQSIPVRHRELEKYMALNEKDEYWKERYYKTLFHCDCTEERIKDICLKYLEAMEWTYTYYRKGCKDWKWCYPHHFAPLLSDLVKYVPHFRTVMLETQPKAPIAALTQLCYVLPKPFHTLLPARAQQVLANKYGACYRTDWELQWAYCKYFWECHVDMAPIHVGQLEADVRS